jgi:hypothetical protein
MKLVACCVGFMPSSGLIGLKNAELGMCEGCVLQVFYKLLRDVPGMDIAWSAIELVVIRDVGM